MARTRKSALFVAVIDDDASVREAIESLLNSVGMKSRGFASAEAYLRASDTAAVGCLILDMRLPGMSGLELQRLLQARGLGGATIFVTGELDCDDRLRVQMEEAGALAILRKPFDAEALMRLVRTAIDARRLR